MLVWDHMPVFGSRPVGQTCIIRPSAYAIIENDLGQLALAHTLTGAFLPGGGIEGDETPEQTVQREVIEECGLIVRPGAWSVAATQFTHSESENAYFEKRCTFIESMIVDPHSTREPTEHELCWRDLHSATQLLTHESHRWALAMWKRRTA
jgi:8-oxo-dGTP diphosphatase